MQYIVKKIRLQKGFSQQVLSKKARVSRQTISNLESGKPVNTTTATLVRLADALGCEVSDFFTV